MNTTIDNRRNKRQNLVCGINLANNTHVYESELMNISKSGIAITNVPKFFIKDIKTPFIGVINKNDINVKLKLRPKWYKKVSSVYYAMGFEIIGSITDNWFSFIKENTTLITKLEQDVWGIPNKYFK